MLNLVAFDTEDDSHVLENSYNAIRNKASLQIITDDAEKRQLVKKIAAVLSTPHDASFSFQNIFRLTLPQGQFYIAQCLLDFGYPVSAKLAQASERKYHFQVIGFAELTIDLGKTLLRRETATDKLIGRFFGNDIDFKEVEEFNDKYYLVSSNKDAVHQCFDKSFTQVISRYNDVILMSRGVELFISFETDIKNNHSRIVEEVFSNCKFLKRSIP